MGRHKIPDWWQELDCTPPVSYWAVKQRLRDGWSIEDALSAGPRERRPLPPARWEVDEAYRLATCERW